MSNYLDDTRSKKKHKSKPIGVSHFLEQEADEASDYEDSDDEMGELKDQKNQFYQPGDLEKKFDSGKVLAKI